MYEAYHADFAKHPITSRGHLLDIPLYLSSKSLEPISPLSTSTPISASTLQGCAEFHGISISPGDVLLVRTGFTEAFESLPDKDREEYKDSEDRASCGVSPDEDVLKWHWDNGIAAVGTDTYVTSASYDGLDTEQTASHTRCTPRQVIHLFTKSSWQAGVYP